MTWLRARGLSLMDLMVLAVLVCAAVIASDYGARARLVPMTVAVGSILLLLLQIVLQARGASLDIDQRELMGREARLAAEEAETREDVLAAVEARSVVTYQGGSLAGGIAVFVGFAALILLIGVLPAVFIFMFGFLVCISRVGIVRSFIAALVTEAVVYGLFVAALGVRMNEGYLVAKLF